MNDVLMNEGRVFDACAVLEEILQLTDVDMDVRTVRDKVGTAVILLNQALEQSNKVR